MIASGLKKLASEHNMQVTKGVAYGSLCGYAATLSEGAGYKQILLTSTFKDPQQQLQLQNILNGRNLFKEFRVQNLTFSNKNITIVFYDNPGTMKKIYAFIDWFFPLLDTYGATKINICSACGGEVTTGQWKLINGGAYYFHDYCAQKLTADIQQADDTRKQEATGSYLTGLIGALLGAALGSIVWAIVLCIGYVASIVGFLIGFLAERGYHLLRGKNGKGKLAILLLSVVFGVFLGTLLYEVFYLAGMIWDGDLYGYTLGAIPYLLSILHADSEYVRALMGDVGIGLIFAALGAFSLFRRTKNEVSDTKVVDL